MTDPKSSERSSSSERLQDPLDEIADDMLELIRRTQSLESGQSTVISALEEVKTLVADGSKSHGRQLTQMHQESVGERKALSAMLAFNAVVGALDQMREMEAGLDAEEDHRMISQLAAINSTLDRVLRTLGFEEFDVQVDEPFDPARMQCSGYEDGEPGVVLRVGRSGYMAGGAVVRPVSVFIAEPNAIK